MGIEVYDLKQSANDAEPIEPMKERLVGRFLINDLYDANGELLMTKDRMMNDDDADRIIKAGIDRVKIRSVLNCRSKYGVCRHCYGANLANGKLVSIGEAVGIIAAQSIGEPGTQLTMRTFHTGGAKDAGDITQGLPRIEELFEARKPKSLAILSEISGTVSFEEIKKSRHVVITDAENGDSKAYLIPYGFREIVKEGDKVTKGQALTDGAPNPHDILAIRGVEAVHDYLIREVQRTYRTQGVDINDKHIEVIVRQMMRKVKIDDAGDTNFLPGSVVEKHEFYTENAKVKAKAEAEGTEPNYATYIPTLMGITKASLATESFLSAASFQETTRVLTDAAIKGKTDPLMGLKENVIIGKLLPSGTGMKCYADVQLRKKEDAPNTVMADLLPID